MIQDNEIFIDIIGYDGKYSVSNLGRVRSNERVVECFNGLVMSKKTYRSTIYRQQIGYGGYKCVTLRDSITKKTRSTYVHRLVALHFCDNTHSKEYVNHKDGNKHNNVFSNLEWVTASENCLHSHRMGLTPKTKGNLGKIGSKNHLSSQIFLFVDDTLSCIFESKTEAIKSLRTCGKTIAMAIKNKKVNKKGVSYHELKLREANISWDQVQEYIGKSKGDLSFLFV